MKRLALILLLLASLAHAGEPVQVLVSNDSVSIAGVTYKSAEDAMEALKKLSPKEVQFVPAPGVRYEVMRAALEAYQKSGIDASLGFVGNEKE